jgi:hypothetical protein
MSVVMLYSLLGFAKGRKKAIDAQRGEIGKDKKAALRMQRHITW